MQCVVNYCFFLRTLILRPTDFLRNFNYFQEVICRKANTMVLHPVLKIIASYIVYILLIIQFLVTKKLGFHSVHSLRIFLSVFDYFLWQIKASL